MGEARRKEDRRLMVFGDAHSMWTEGRLTQEQAAELLGVSARTFRRWTDRYGEDGIEGLRGPAGVARLAPRGAGGRGDADGGQVPDRSRRVVRRALPPLLPGRGRGRGATTGSGTSSRSTGP